HGTALWPHGGSSGPPAASRRHIHLRPQGGEPHSTLGTPLGPEGRPDEAAAAYRRAIELKPDLPEAHCNLGRALQRQGEFTKALAALQRGHELGSRRKGWPYPSARWAEECRRLGDLEGRLPAVLRGDAPIADAFERNEFARLCFYKQLNVASARLRAEAFTADAKLADDRQYGNRYEAACAAALAGCGRGADAG